MNDPLFKAEILGAVLERQRLRETKWMAWRAFWARLFTHGYWKALTEAREATKE